MVNLGLKHIYNFPNKTQFRDISTIRKSTQNFVPHIEKKSSKLLTVPCGTPPDVAPKHYICILYLYFIII